MTDPADLRWPTEEYGPIPDGFVGVCYVCGLCSTTRHWLAVPVRHPDGSMQAWMNIIVALVQNHHQRVAPRCVAVALQEICFPVTPQAPGVVMGPQ